MPKVEVEAHMMCGGYEEVVNSGALLALTLSIPKECVRQRSGGRKDSQRPTQWCFSLRYTSRV